MTVTGAPVLPPAGARSRRSTRGFWFGGLLTAAAVIGAIVWVVVAFLAYQQQVDRFTRTTIPGVATVRLADTATRVIYHENVRGTRTPGLAELGVTVTGPGGAAVSVGRYSADLRYDVPGETARIGRAVGEFRPPQPGAYRVRSVPTAGVTGTLAVGGDNIWDIAPHAAGAAALLLLGGGAGVALLVVAGVRRARRVR